MVKITNHTTMDEMGAPIKNTGIGEITVAGSLIEWEDVIEPSVILRTDVPTVVDTTMVGTPVTKPTKKVQGKITTVHRPQEQIQTIITNNRNEGLC